MLRELRVQVAGVAVRKVGAGQVAPVGVAVAVLLNGDKHKDEAKETFARMQRLGLEPHKDRFACVLRSSYCKDVDTARDA